jgi:hypothetical protein
MRMPVMVTGVAEARIAETIHLGNFRELFAVKSAGVTLKDVPQVRLGLFPFASLGLRSGQAVQPIPYCCRAVLAGGDGGCPVATREIITVAQILRRHSVPGDPACPNCRSSSWCYLPMREDISVWPSQVYGTVVGRKMNLRRELDEESSRIIAIVISLSRSMEQKPE